MTNKTDENNAEKLMNELEKRAEKRYSLSYNEANQIINDLGNVIEILNRSTLFTLYKPETVLPREKSIVLDAIAVCFQNSKPDSQDRQNLYMAFLLAKEEFVSDEVFIGNIKLVNERPNGRTV